MVTARRFLPLLLGVAAAMVIAGVAAAALPWASDPSPAVPSVEEAVHAAGAGPANVAPEEAAAKTPIVGSLDPVKVDAAYDSFPAVPRSVREASVNRQAERVAAKLAVKEAEQAREAEEARKQAEEKANAEAKARAEAEAKAEAEAQAEAKAAAEAQRKGEKDVTAGTGEGKEPDKQPKDETGEKQPPTDPAWWPQHVWGHAVSCAVAGDRSSVIGTWDVWLKYGGDWAFVSASPAPAEVSGTDGDKVMLTYRDVAAALQKEHDGKAKYRAGPVSLTVQEVGDPSSQRTFEVDLWVVADAEGRCPA